MELNAKEIKKDFPVLSRVINGKPLVYLDNGATSQMPKEVLDAIYDFDSNHRANVHRGIHTLSEEATTMFENARATIAKFIGAVVPEEIVFVRNTTEAINLAAFAWARKNINEGDIILVSEIEHHSNLVPWQQIAKEKNAEINFIPVSDNGEIILKDLSTDWTRVKLVAINQVSNVLGSTVNIKEFIKFIKRRVIEAKNKNFPRVLVDGAQAVPHMKVNVQSLGCDFYAFSGHKMCGPMGIGVLWINREIWSELDAFLTGGGMIKEVSLVESTFTEMPEMLEAGTPNVSGAVGLATACDYLNKIGMDKIHNHEIKLTKYALERLEESDDVEIYGKKDLENRSGVIAFNLKDVPAHDLSTILSSEGVAVRSGQHCVMPWHITSGARATVRASLYFYNSEEDIDALIKGIQKAREILKGAI